MQLKLQLSVKSQIIPDDHGDEKQRGIGELLACTLRREVTVTTEGDSYGGKQSEVRVWRGDVSDGTYRIIFETFTKSPEFELNIAESVLNLPEKLPNLRNFLVSLFNSVKKHHKICFLGDKDYFIRVMNRLGNLEKDLNQRNIFCVI
jgi:hypothetical protein